MRDIFFILFMVFLFGLGFVQPYLGTVAYIWIDLLQPQHQSYYLINSIPISMISAIYAVLIYAIADKEKTFSLNVIQVLLVVFTFYITVTTINADLVEEAWFKWSASWKVLLFSVFLPLAIRTRLHVETTLFVILFTVCALIFSGAIKTALGSGGYGHLSFLVDLNNGLFESSTIATVSVGLIAIALYLYRNSQLFPRSRWTLAACIVLIVCSLLVVIGSESRTGLICIAAVAALEFRHVKRKFLVAALGALTFLAAVPFLPASFTGRMGTIRTYDEDTSASTRVAMWQWTWSYVKQHPFGGGFHVWKRSQIVYQVRTRQNGREGSQQVKDEARGFHSTFFEVLGEQGFLGLFLFALIFISALVQNTMIVSRFKRDPEHRWMAECARALTSFTIVYLIGGLFQAIAYQSTVYYFIGLTMTLWALRKRIMASSTAPSPAFGRRLPSPQRA